MLPGMAFHFRHSLGALQHAKVVLPVVTCLVLEKGVD